MENATRNAPNYMSFVKWLQLLFIAFKLANIITWSWWLVIIPMASDIIVTTLRRYIKDNKNAKN